MEAPREHDQFAAVPAIGPFIQRPEARRDAADRTVAGHYLTHVTDGAVRRLSEGQARRLCKVPRRRQVVQSVNRKAGDISRTCIGRRRRGLRGDIVGDGQKLAPIRQPTISRAKSRAWMIW